MVFNEAFSTALRAMDPSRDFTAHEIRTAIRNSSVSDSLFLGPHANF